MKKVLPISVSISPEWGSLVECLDHEVADQFEDYIVETLDMSPPKQKHDSEGVTFFFGKEYSITQLQEIVNQFILCY